MPDIGLCSNFVKMEIKKEYFELYSNILKQLMEKLRTKERSDQF